MFRIVGSRELNQYENDPNYAVGVFATPLTTKWIGNSPCRLMGLAPTEFKGTVLDIGSGDDVLALELYAAGVDATVHRVNPALGPDAPIEVQTAMREAIYARAARMGVDIDVVRSWGLSHNAFPDITGLPKADHIVSNYCFPTIDVDCHTGGISKLRAKMDIGFEALSALSHPWTDINLGPIARGAPFEEVKRAIQRQKALRKKRMDATSPSAGKVLLRLV